MSEESLTANRRCSYTPQFKAEMLAQCVQSNVSLASLAVEHGMNPNVLHRWVSEHERYGRHALMHDPASVKPAPLAERTRTCLAIHRDSSCRDHGKSCPWSGLHSFGSDARFNPSQSLLADQWCATVCCVSTRVAAVIRIDHIGLSVEPVDMRCGVDRLLARVIEVFGRSEPHHAYVFANRRGLSLEGAGV